MLRARRNCSDGGQFNKELEVVKSRLRARGYSEWMLNRAERIARSRPRETMLANKKPSVKNQTRSEQQGVSFVTTYSVEFNEVSKIFKKNLPILKGDPDLAEILSTPPRVVSRRAQSLGSVLAPSMVSSREKKAQKSRLSTQGSYRCGAKRCGCCKVMEPSKTFYLYPH